MVSPLVEYKFGVITYEHDYYTDESKSYRDLSRKFLKSKGYKLMVSNIAPNDTDIFEDWWIEPTLILSSNWTKLNSDDSTISNARDFMIYS